MNKFILLVDYLIMQDKCVFAMSLSIRVRETKRDCYWQTRM